MQISPYGKLRKSGYYLRWPDHHADGQCGRCSDAEQLQHIKQMDRNRSNYQRLECQKGCQ
ncbi:hypothetical protein D3C80_1229120 [compost metagenome]